MISGCERDCHIDLHSQPSRRHPLEAKGGKVCACRKVGSPEALGVAIGR